MKVSRHSCFPLSRENLFDMTSEKRAHDKDCLNDFMHRETKSETPKTTSVQKFSLTSLSRRAMTNCMIIALLISGIRPVESTWSLYLWLSPSTIDH